MTVAVPEMGDTSVVIYVFISRMDEASNATVYPEIRTAGKPAVTVALPTITSAGRPVANLNECVPLNWDVEVGVGDALLVCDPFLRSGISDSLGLMKGSGSCSAASSDVEPSYLPDEMSGSPAESSPLEIIRLRRCGLGLGDRFEREGKRA